MAESTTHNPDQYMMDLRQILAQGRKRVGLLIGAGAPTSMRVDADGRLVEEGKALIPDVSGITTSVIEGLNESDKATFAKLKTSLAASPNIELILTRIRQLATAIGDQQLYGLNRTGFSELADRICDKIGEMVGAHLPSGRTPYCDLVSWIGGIHREHAVEIFTPNYDLLLEEAFERGRLAYFDGFTGAHRPFFDPVSITEDKLPARWSRIWKLHGSLGWETEVETIIRTGSRTATKLIYPDHLKYEHITRQPYSALFERLRTFLTTPDTLLICTGFSFRDAHICAVLDEALAANSHTAVLAFQHKGLAEEPLAVAFGGRRPNLSVYGKDGAIIFGVSGKWRPGQLPSEEWKTIRGTFWSDTSEFLLGDFSKLARFFALAQASTLVLPLKEKSDPTAGSPSTEAQADAKP